MMISQSAARIARPKGHLRPAVWGASGFALGGFMSGLVLYALMQPALEIQRGVLVALLLNAAFLVLGAVGGAASALAIRELRRVGAAALAGGIAFVLAGLGNPFDFSTVMPVFIDGIRGGTSNYWKVVFVYFLSFAVKGALGGAALAATLIGAKKFRQILVAGLVGGIGFGVGGIIGFGIFNFPVLGWVGWWSATLVQPIFGEGAVEAVWLAGVSLVGGTCLAIALSKLRYSAVPATSSSG